MSKETIIKGTLILTVAGIITKFLGFYNRIFLTRLIGVTELGIYQLTFPLYILAISISCQGISTTLTKQVSYYMGQKKEKSARQIFLISVILSLLLSIFLGFILNSFSRPISLYILKNSRCSELLKIATIALPFIAVKTCINSFFIGLNKPLYHGISHLVEQIVRILTAYLLSIFWATNKINAVLAITAVISGEIFATALSIIIYLFYKKGHFTKKETSVDRKIYKHFLKDVFPITANNVMLTLFSSLEAIMLPAMLYKFYMISTTSMEIYGIITGIVIPFLLFPSTITTSLSTMLLPAVSFAKAKNDNRTIRSALKKSVLFCFALGIVASLLYLILGDFLCEFAFHNKVAGHYLTKMSFLCPFIYISGNLTSILNGTNKAFLNLMFNIASIVIRIIFIVLWVPKYGIDAYIIGLFISYAMLDVLMMVTSCKHNINCD